MGGLLIHSRHVPVLILLGMLFLIAAGFLLRHLHAGNTRSIISAASALLGLAGATVSPALWMAGVSLQSQMVGRIFALLELVRSVADFLLAPVILEISHMASANPAPTTQGIAQASWYTTLITIAATALCVVLYLLGTPALPKPDLDAWSKENKPAFRSPPLLATLRRSS